VLRWNGFRPRAAGLDKPVEFRRGARRDTTADTSAADVTDTSAGVLPPAALSPPIRPTASRPARRGRSAEFTVSFAALLDEAQAQNLAYRIHVDGQRARVTSSNRAGKTLYRVVLGPYPTRAQAERAGQASGQSYWVFEGAP
jgi:rare lipoprotein A